MTSTTRSRLVGPMRRVATPSPARTNRVAQALQVPLDELIAEPRAACRFYPCDQLTEKRRGDVRLRNLLPDPLPGMVLDRMELPRGRN